MQGEVCCGRFGSDNAIAGSNANDERQMPCLLGQTFAFPTDCYGQSDTVLTGFLRKSQLTTDECRSVAQPWAIRDWQIR